MQGFGVIEFLLELHNILEGRTAGTGEIPLSLPPRERVGADAGY